MRWYYGPGVVTLAMLLSSGCGSDDKTPDPSASGQTAASGTSKPFMGRVALASFGSHCRKVRCWLPTQFQPWLVAGKSVSLKEKDGKDGWPLDGDPIKVTCVTKGGWYRDGEGHSAKDWYGVVIPVKRLDPGGTEAKKIAGSEDRRAYVPVAWITGGEGKRMPAC